ncbi:hypothetical protein TNCV_2122231 [Trichonephila clavipes]|nr:hypothetical protein TNCV_2122231 [Trichonephila clavipes]
MTWICRERSASSNVIVTWLRLKSTTSIFNKAAFTPRLSASSVERLANQGFHLVPDEVLDWLDTQSSTLTALVLDESRSFFRVHTGYFSNIPKCIKQSSSPVGHVLSPVLYRAPSVRINLIVCLIELCTSFELCDKFGGGAGYNYVKRG